MPEEERKPQLDKRQMSDLDAAARPNKDSDILKVKNKLANDNMNSQTSFNTSHTCNFCHTANQRLTNFSIHNVHPQILHLPQLRPLLLCPWRIASMPGRNIRAPPSRKTLSPKPKTPHIHARPIQHNLQTERAPLPHHTHRTRPLPPLRSPPRALTGTSREYGGGSGGRGC